jgi:hypothetical protein
MNANIDRNASTKHGREAPIWAIFALSGASALLTGLLLIAVA